jgi:hypothetical protein
VGDVGRQPLRCSVAQLVSYESYINRHCVQKATEQIEGRTEGAAKESDTKLQGKGSGGKDTTASERRTL